MKKILILLLALSISIIAAVLPVNKLITSTYSDITSDIVSLDLSESENFTIYDDGGSPIEVLVDETGVADINSTFNNKGIDIESESLKEFMFAGNTKYYARSKTGTAALIKINVVGFLGVHDADVHHVMVNKELHSHGAADTNLTVEIVGDGTEYQISVADATGFAVGDFLHIENGSQEATHPKLLSSNPSLPTAGAAVFTLDRRIDDPHPIGTEVVSSILDMASVGGTLASPVEYWVQPPAGEIWHIERFLFSMAHDTAGDLGKFGNIASLTNGVVVRTRINNTFRTLTNWKNAGEIKVDMFDVDFPTRSGGQGDYGTTGRWTFKKSGTVIQLNGDTNDRIQVLVDDNLTALGFFLGKMQGHVVKF